jgi:hypothetical protein
MEKGVGRVSDWACKCSILAKLRVVKQALKWKASRVFYQA